MLIFLIHSAGKTSIISKFIKQFFNLRINVEQSTVVFIGIIFSILIPLILVFFSKTKPLIATLPPGYNLKEQADKWNSFDIVLYLFEIMVIIVSVVTVSGILILISPIFLPNPDSVDFLIVPSKFLLVLPGLFGGFIVTAWASSTYLKKRLNPSELEEFRIYKSAQHKINEDKLGYYLLAFLIPIVLIMIVLFMNNYASLSNDKIAINSLFSIWKTTYSYEDIGSIKRTDSFKAPSGTIVRKPYYEIHFKDDFIWSFNSELAAPTDKEEVEIINYLIAKSGKQLEILDPYGPDEYN